MSEGKVQQKQQARRAEIVVAAQKCFAEKGLHGASVADIAREAGLSVGQLYRIFASKEAIIEAIVSEIVNARVGEMRTTIWRVKRRFWLAGSRRRQPPKAIIIC